MTKFFPVFFLFIFFNGTQAWTESRLKVICSTSDIYVIVKSIGQSKVTALSLVQGRACPGHFDIRPEHALQAARADLLLYHGWENWMPQLIQSIGNRRLKKMEIKIPGNWMIPPVHMKAAENITKALIHCDPKNKFFYQNNLKNHKKNIRKTVHILRQKTNFLSNTRAVCAQKQAGFLEWLGITVVQEYGREEELTLPQLLKTMSLSKEKTIDLVVDNLQSGPETGRSLAEALQVPHITLSRFPLQESYTKELSSNIKKIQTAFDKPQ